MLVVFLAHGDRYDYTNTIYKSGIKPQIEIICKIHGSFWQRADQHWAGQGCKQCRIDAYIKSASLTLEEFIEQASIVHNFKYNYSLVIYVNSYTKIKIICPTHGLF